MAAPSYTASPWLPLTSWLPPRPMRSDAPTSPTWLAEERFRLNLSLGGLGGVVNHRGSGRVGLDRLDALLDRGFRLVAALRLRETDIQHRAATVVGLGERPTQGFIHVVWCMHRPAAAAASLCEGGVIGVGRDGFQCGYCTSGQIVSAHAMLAEHARGDLSAASFEESRRRVSSGDVTLSQNEIRERMGGNICRCGAYANIVAAIVAVAEGETR